MNKKPKPSFSLVIRRFFSIFLLFSIVSGIINDILSGTFSGDSIGGAVGGLVIVFFLSGIFRRSKTPNSDDGSKETMEEDKDIYDEETLQEFEKYDSEEVVVKESEITNNGYAGEKYAHVTYEDMVKTIDELL